MGETKTARAPLFLGAEFNAFLFEPIGADAKGRQVSVVSALARLDMDPWAEAERLSRLPDETAVRSVSMVLSRLPEIACGIAERHQNALRLVRLLPKRLAGLRARRPLLRPATPRASQGASGGASTGPFTAGLFCLVAVLLLGQLLWRDHTAPPARQTASASHAVPAPRSQGGD